MSDVFLLMGFMVAVAFGLWLTLFAGLACFNSLGTYNIGGVPNRWYTKLATLLLAGAVCAYWWWLFSVAAPFEITYTAH